MSQGAHTFDRIFFMVNKDLRSSGRLLAERKIENLFVKESPTRSKFTVFIEKIKMFWRKSRIRCFWLVKCIFMRYNTHTS